MIYHPFKQVSEPEQKKKDSSRKPESRVFGGRYWDRTSDPSRVGQMLSFELTRPHEAFL